MLVEVKYHDQESLLIEEVIKRAKDNYGKQVSVRVYPESDTPIDGLYFAIQRLITGDLVTLFYESGHEYSKQLGLLRADITNKFNEVLNDVIIDVEHRLSRD